MSLDRRHFLAAGAGAAGALLAGCASTGPAASRPAQPFFIGSPAQMLMPKGKAPRVVVCGGGWGGLTTAKYLRQLAPSAEVVLLERNPVFFSCPISNKWLVDMVDTSFITHDYLRVSAQHGYRFVQCEVLEIDRGARRVVTSQGALDYDYLVIAPGIRYNYEAWFGNDRAIADATRTRFPAAYVSNAEHFALKKALHGFKGGDWVMTLPPPPQRCPPSPYERACMVAWYFKANKIKGRVTILDHKDGVRPIGPGFRAAFTELYKDYITYVPNAHVQSIDPFKKEIKTDAGDMKFDHAVLMAPHQAGDLAWKADAIGLNSQGKYTGWADVDPLMLNLKNDPNVYVIGDAVGFVSPQFAFYPKSAHVANQHGHIVAAYIAERVAGRSPKATLPDNLCYMMVNGDPREAISVQFDYKVNAQGVIEQTQIDINQRSADLVRENFRWAGLKFDDMFS
ncbi:FAD/NAD(P)-binding oxidoreductase [Hydrogenophaga sp.]|uniref:NAD(P)/FAD-dependent oxidoreductase n=1 Tax=Hydrogenophaga sp. TaxID=1904254 RepID=UPI00262DB8EA|nr:FAD/NAD(P)-binding oxidoreductase [Hydrogenophaga sp.]MCW5653613.1 NAD(P)/FAD-dependent oxidoreductase [Hydrogenophaga sp.]